MSGLAVLKLLQRFTERSLRFNATVARRGEDAVACSLRPGARQTSDRSPRHRACNAPSHRTARSNADSPFTPRILSFMPSNFSTMTHLVMRPQHRLWVVLLALTTLGACRDTTFLTAPEDPQQATIPPCNSADCNTFRGLSNAALETPAAAASQVATSSLGDQALGTRLSDRIQQIRNDMNANRRDPARLQLLAVLADIDRALADQSRRADWPDLSMIRLNLEPFIINLGLR
jgi:hypothetical protein